MESKQKIVEDGECKQECAEDICDIQELEQTFAEELAEEINGVDFGPMITALINEDVDQNTKAAICNVIARNAIHIVKRADVIRKRKQIRFGPAAVVIAAKE